MTENLYSQKGDDYYSTTRHELVELIPAGTRRLLDVGCADGATGLSAKAARQIAEVVGIEFHTPAARSASEKLDRVIPGDIETVSLDCPHGYFDCILCADVLEHTRDPWSVLRKLRPLLDPDGTLIASIPNFRHLHPILKIIFNRFEYMESGILDKTHLRIFTEHTIRRMFEDSGFRITDVRRNYSTKWMFRWARILSFGLLAPLTVYQFVLVAKRDV